MRAQQPVQQGAAFAIDLECAADVAADVAAAQQFRHRHFGHGVALAVDQGDVGLATAAQGVAQAGGELEAAGPSADDDYLVQVIAGLGAHQNSPRYGL